MIDPLLKSYTAGLSVLFVEDDPVGAAIIQKMLETLFKRVYGAANGAEGLRQFHLYQPDLIVTDLMMPVMDGIAMLQELRKSNQKVPVLLMTASLEHVHLVEAINLGVSKFLAKPLRADALQRALLAITRELHLERVAEQARLHEVELLQYRNRYHSSQQELAQAKERHIAANMFEKKYLHGGGNGGWLVDLLQQPRDIMSGDSYSIIQSKKNTLLIFLADAMGHGLSASVTSMLTTAFFNHGALGCACEHLGFSHLANSTMLFASRNLLEDEVFSGLVMELDPQRNTLRFVCCGMPALMVVRNGQVERIRGLNPPVSAFSPPLQLQEISLEGISDILLATDGLGDVEMREGGSYLEQLPADLLATATARELFARYEHHCDDSQNDDDITFIRLAAVGAGAGARQQCLRSCGTLAGIATLQRDVRQLLEDEGAAGETLDNLELALSEALMNAFEHGCLGMGADKQRLMLEGEYDDLVMAAEPDEHKQISLTLTLLSRQGRLQVWLEVVDPGPGFHQEQGIAQCRSAAVPCGRGFIMMRRSVDLVRRNSAGNRVVLMQLFDGSTPPPPSDS
jgi:CheY-like chemotaxis protein/anti-sigma regulatory factor (Ser/Thr protein kinase)